MKSNQTKNRIGATLIAMSLLFVIGAVSRQTAQAQDRNYPYGQDNNRNQNRRNRNWDNYGNYGGSFELRQTALNAGYNEGLKDGAEALARNRNSDFASQNAYRKATRDYNSRLGDRETYRRYFREAYQNGFSDGFYPQGAGYDNRNQNRRSRRWDRYDNFGGSQELHQTALNAGYNEGIKEGRRDRNRNGGYDFRNKSAYRQATKDYSSKLGDRSVYQRYFRAGFENGYNDGLNGN